MKKLSLILMLAALVSFELRSQDMETIEAAREAVADKDIIKQGYSFGPFPIVAFDQNKGLQLGALCNIYNFGDGTWYPTPKSQWYIEASFFTTGSQLFVVNYDNKTLIPNTRMSISATFNNSKALDFMGFNGYNQVIDRDLPSAYYKMSRMVPAFKADFTGRICKHFYWKAGYHFKWFKTGTYESKDGHMPTLYEDYVNEGYIPADQAQGGFTSSVRAGLMYDTRDFEPAPTKGIWAEANVEGAPSWLGTSVPYIKYYVALCHYVPVVREKLTFAFRVNWQGFFNDPAYYVLPYESQLGYGYDRDGFGGYRTIRGIALNRIQGRSIFYYNAEFRYRFVDFHLWKQNVGLAVNAFCDGGQVLIPYGNRKEDAPERLHISAGGGFRIIVNRNFIIAAEYGVPFNSQDSPIGKSGSFYVNTGYLF